MIRRRALKTGSRRAAAGRPTAAAITVERGGEWKEKKVMQVLSSVSSSEI